MFETAGFQNVLDTASVVRTTFIRTKSSVFSNDILYSYLDNQTQISRIILADRAWCTESKTKERKVLT